MEYYVVLEHVRAPEEGIRIIFSPGYARSKLGRNDVFRTHFSDGRTLDKIATDLSSRIKSSKITQWDGKVGVDCPINDRYEVIFTFLRYFNFSQPSTAVLQ